MLRASIPVSDSRLVLRFAPTLAPPMQMDLTRGRETAVAWTLGEVVRIGADTGLPPENLYTVKSGEYDEV